MALTIPRISLKKNCKLAPTMCFSIIGRIHAFSSHIDRIWRISRTFFGPIAAIAEPRHASNCRMEGRDSLIKDQINYCSMKAMKVHTAQHYLPSVPLGIYFNQNKIALVHNSHDSLIPLSNILTNPISFTSKHTPSSHNKSKFGQWGWFPKHDFEL